MVTPRFVYSVYETRLQNKIKNENLPQHIGLIHDGHRRYARRENLLSYEVSYRIGMIRFKECLSWCDELGINHVTSWLLSKENLSRPEEELSSYYFVLNELFQELLIDDLVDSGDTAKIVRDMMPNSKFVVLYAKTSGRKQADLHLYDFKDKDWLVFPWEQD